MPGGNTIKVIVPVSWVYHQIVLVSQVGVFTNDIQLVHSQVIQNRASMLMHLKHHLEEISSLAARFPYTSPPGEVT